jgi:hypothetical protein
MSCFTLEFVEQLLVWLVIVCAIIAILRLFLPWIAAQLGAVGGMVLAIINIVLWAIVCIYVIYFVFMLIGCLAGSGGFLLPHGRL